jgi:hypothetical protein
MELEQNMPKYGAVYAVLWKRGEDGFFRVADEYTLKERRRFLFLNNYILVDTVLSFAMHAKLCNACETVLSHSQSAQVSSPEAR